MSHPQVSPQARNLLKHLREFESYIRANASMIPNYGERRRYGEAVSTAFVESTVNQVVAKRFAKKQQMQWTPRGVHLLVQLRVRTLDDTLANDFRSEEHTSELQSLMRISYAVFCLKKKK